MEIKKNTPYGDIKISNEVIATLVGNATTECYGVVGLVSKNNAKKVLKSDEFSKGVLIEKDKKSGFNITIYVVLAYGVKVSEILNEIQKRVKYVLEKTFEIKFNSINVFVAALKETL